MAPRTLTVPLVLAALAGCTGKLASRGAAAAPPPKPPTKVAAAALNKDSLSFDVDEKTGRPRGSLILSLDAFPPPPTPGAGALPACYPPFAAGFELGVVACEGRPDQTQPLTGANVDQACYTDLRGPRASATAPLALAGCRKAVLAVHGFDPPLRVDLEVRDVN